MAIPDFQSAMLPVLRLSEDGAEHSLKEALERVASVFNTTPEERQHLLPSGRQTTLYSRVSWAKSYLVKADLLEAVGRGRFRIAKVGREVLATNPPRIDLDLLNQVSPGALGLAASDEGGISAAPAATKTPEEVLEDSSLLLRRRLADELLERVKASSPAFFERLVIDLLVAMGYGGSRKDAAKVVGQSGDEGIDGLINEDRLGLDVVYVQAKRWTRTVGRPEVQGFAGSLEGKRARKGVFITTSDFSREARQYVERIEKKIVLIDGELLASLMIDNRVGVAEMASYVVSRIDLDYFVDEAEGV